MSFILGTLWILFATFVIVFAFSRWGEGNSARSALSDAAAVIAIAIIGLAIIASVMGLLFVIQWLIGSVASAIVLAAIVLAIVFAVFKDETGSNIKALRNMALCAVAVAFITTPFFIFA